MQNKKRVYKLIGELLELGADGVGVRFGSELIEGFKTKTPNMTAEEALKYCYDSNKGRGCKFETEIKPSLVKDFTYGSMYQDWKRRKLNDSKTSN